MSGGSQHNPNGRQSQLGSGWSPLQLQVASYLARAPQAHMASERGVTWHTPTPPHLYHVPAPSPPDPLQLQAMKVGAAANAAFRHTATPPDLYRHTPTPPDKHLMSSRHTPSPGDVKGGPIPPPDIYQHLGQARDKLVRPEDMLSYARGGVDLTLGRSAAANGAPIALSVRDAPTINSLIARAQPLPHPRPHPRVDSLLERLAPSPVSPHSVIVHPRGPATPSPPDSNEDSADSCGAPPGSKRKRKPERVVRVPSVPPPLTPPDPIVAPPKPPEREPKPEPVSRLSPPKEVEPEKPDAPLENGETSHATSNGPEPPEKTDPPEPEPHTRRKTRSGSAETIDDIAAMIASTDKTDGKDEPDTPEKPTEAMEIDAPVTIDKLKSVLASPEPEPRESKIEEPKKSPPKTEEPITDPVVEAAAAPKRRRARSSKETSESTNVPVESPSEAKPAEAEASEAKSAEAEAKSAEPVPASIVDVEDQLEKMFAGIEEEPGDDDHPGKQTNSATALPGTAKGKKRRKSVATKGEKKLSRRSSRASTGDEGTKRKAGRKRGGGVGAGGGVRGRKNNEVREYDSGSNASSGRSRGPYIQIRGPRDSPLSVSVINAATGEEEETAGGGRRKGGEEFRNGIRTRGLHCSTLGLRYDATTPDASWVCAFCERGPHSPPAPGDAPLPHRPLGDLFGPYTVSTDCEEFRALDEVTRKKRAPVSGDVEVWFHEECAVWAPGLLAWGARVWGLPSAVWGAAGARCEACGRDGAGLSCARHACVARSHVPCARATGWQLSEAQYRALCPRHGSG